MCTDGGESINKLRSTVYDALREADASEVSFEWLPDFRRDVAGQ